MALEIQSTNAFVRAVKHLDPDAREQIGLGIASYAALGRGDTKALKGNLKGKLRLRVGKWRVIFRIDEARTMVLLNVGKRGDIY
ncbi:MAG: type II toxin-antitoxin system RelE/ParE family toxin [Bryobacterales bacterium]|nr:type II toxin-antitoxin system RelE/ParE family toxin [Bryobacterales bacterium]